LRDGISLDAQKFFDIRFSIEYNAIIIPIYNEVGDIIGAKARINGDPEEGESKYYYPIPVQVSQTLYGYSKNYEHLYGADTIYIGESEKFCMQLYTMGIRNCVSIGSHTISEKQAKLLLQLSPKSITFMLDEGLDLSETKRNIDIIKSVSSMMQVNMYYFDHTECLELGPKDAPSDHGIEVWNEIIENYIKNANELDEVI
jgi:DNA primase